MPEEHSRGARLVVGLISGTSMDGIDAALVRISGPATQPRVRLLGFETYRYSAPVRRRILRIAAGEAATAGEISQLNFLLGELFAEATLRVCRTARVPLGRLAAIGTHGQTIYHQGSPTREAGRLVTSTLQVAEPAVIAERTGAPVVADFRPADMAAGGQGAPLVPLVDYLLLRDARRGTVALNIGGIANFTVIPANARPEDVFGFDTGPGNMIIDGLVRHFSHGQKTYDAGGRWAARGRVIEPLLAQVLREPFFQRQPPKSAGREEFGQRFVEHFFLKRRGARAEDLLRTATELTPRTITDALDRFVLGSISIHRLIVSGGGAHNRLLVSRLSQLLPRLRVQLSDACGLPVDAKEAIAFAVLADRTMHGLPGNLPRVTGARRAVVLGKISRP
ncbi:MAG: anhydro-N-acetylmuramic acid kinase [Acidobacteriia bacterium]|nr:anhydro-N-acetylmuramic acid kinase [Terriglobia bacterium]